MTIMQENHCLVGSIQDYDLSYLPLILACSSGWLSVDNRCLYKTPPDVAVGGWAALSACRWRNGWLASINTKEIYANMSEFPHQGVNYWIGASDISEEGTYMHG